MEVIARGGQALVLPGLAPGVSQALLATQYDRRGTDRQVDRGGRPQRSTHTYQLDQDKSGEGRPNHRAERVQAIQASERWLEQASIVAHQRSRQHWQRPTHERGGNQQDQRGESKPQRHAGGAAEPKSTRGAEVDPMREAEHERRDDAERTNGDLEFAVQHRWPWRAVGDPAEQPGAQPEAAHIRRDDGCDGLNCRAERLIEDADPQQLVHQAGRAREKEEDAVEEGRLRTHAAHASPARDPPPVAGCSPRGWARTRRRCRWRRRA